MLTLELWHSPSSIHTHITPEPQIIEVGCECPDDDICACLARRKAQVSEIGCAMIANRLQSHCGP